MNKTIFPGQQEDEVEARVYRKHPIVLCRKFTFYIFTLVILLVIYLLIKNFTSWLDDSSSFLYMILVMAAGLYVLFTLLFLFYTWVDYYLDLLIVTNERIINIRQEGLFDRSISELRLYRIQDVTSETKGFLATIFKYGKIEIQTASEQDKFIFEQIPHPELVANRIMELHEKYVEAKGLAGAEDNLPRKESQINSNQQKDETKPV